MRAYWYSCVPSSSTASSWKKTFERVRASFGATAIVSGITGSVPVPVATPVADIVVTVTPFPFHVAPETGCVALWRVAYPEFSRPHR
ncbi:hypothetical protein GCM10010363_67500 [Streptomyces omiyaensis]|nr:hypothetical protein GCM10010363_67500 [Streptomyces omiyaensis]